MKIAFSGVQCTGKTTLMKCMEKLDEFKQFNFCFESIRSLLKSGFKINQDGDDNTQIAVMNAHIYNLTFENSVLDRCLLDGMCYTQYAYNHNKISEKTFTICEKLFKMGINEYDIIFYIKPEFEMIEDGTRSTDITFRDEVQNIFENYISKYNLSNVVLLSGSVEERMEQINKCLKEIKN